MPSSASSSEGPVLVILVGPTAAGKSAMALLLAERFTGEIVSCDSMQVYCGFDIGTDKPGPQERRRVPHHLIDIRDGREQFTAADFAVLASRTIGEITARGRLPIVAGGTGLYVKALLDGLFPGPGRDESVRTELEEEARRDGLDALYARLEAVDPAYAAKIGRRDRIRIVRALEVRAVTGTALSEHFRRTTGFVPGYRTIRIGLERERGDLCRRIEERTARMFARGLVDEVRGLQASGLDDSAPPFKALGYRHALAVLRGGMTIEEAASRTAVDTRRYAKRQMTWFRRMDGIRWFGAEDGEGIVRFLDSNLE
ncbi:MAG: tRNA (adenosine(37)-N6)-dimethylallyltransferase MiaA [Acidobacteriota bacterium]|nr:tRNA (adenosine(37)-N6)-dimethylallyltransferase MiaA [Acidobacteriota bacterium]